MKKMKSKIVKRKYNRKRKTNYNHKRKTKKKHKRTKKNKMKGGDNEIIPNPTPLPIPVPPPPPPPEPPEPIDGLNLIKRFEDIKPHTLYALMTSNDKLFVYTTTRNKHEDTVGRIGSWVFDQIDVFRRFNMPCDVELFTRMHGFSEGCTQDGWWDNYMYRIPDPSSENPESNPNYLCRHNNEWKRSNPILCEPGFNYIKSFYNMYEWGWDWPPFLPFPPVENSGFSEECSSQYIKENIGHVYCNSKCCGAPKSGYVCGVNDGLGACVKKADNEKNPTY